MISVAEAVELVPIFDPRHFVGAMIDVHEGHVDPAGVTHAFAKAARSARAPRCTATHGPAPSSAAAAATGAAAPVAAARVVSAVSAGGWRVILYDTASGENLGAIDCEHVVNCGGLWAREVGRMVGLELPVLAMEHTYMVTEPLEEVREHNRRTGTRLMNVIDFGGENLHAPRGRRHAAGHLRAGLPAVVAPARRRGTSR